MPHEEECFHPTITIIIQYHTDCHLHHPLTLLTLLISAPEDTKSFTISKWPFLDAEWREMLPYYNDHHRHYTDIHHLLTLWVPLIYAPEDTKSFTTCKCPYSHAKWRGVHHHLLTSSAQLIFAPEDTRSFTTSKWPLVHASWRGVLPPYKNHNHSISHWLSSSSFSHFISTIDIRSWGYQKLHYLQVTTSTCVMKRSASTLQKP